MQVIQTWVYYYQKMYAFPKTRLHHLAQKGNSSIRLITLWGLIPTSISSTNLPQPQACSNILRNSLNFFSRSFQIFLSRNLNKCGCFKCFRLFCHRKIKTSVVFCTRCFRCCPEWVRHTDPDSGLKSSCIARKSSAGGDWAKGEAGRGPEASHSSYGSTTAF